MTDANNRKRQTKGTPIGRWFTQKVRTMTTNTGVLDGLTKDERFAAARNSNTPTVVLTQLASDEDEYVRSEVADNSNTPPEALTQLASDEIEYVRRRVAYNPNTPPEALTQLASDEREKVRRGVANNPNTPPGVKQ